MMHITLFYLFAVDASLHVFWYGCSCLGFTIIICSNFFDCGETRFDLSKIITWKMSQKHLDYAREKRN